MNKCTRRDFLKMGGILGAGLTGFALVGCSGNDASTEQPVDSQDSVQADSSDSSTLSTTQPTDGNGKILVAYYSAQGHTRRVAEVAANELGADIFEIVPEEIYSDADLTWTDSDSRVTREHDNESLRDVPLVQTTSDDWADYDTVLLGYPIWWGIAAWPCDHFATDNDFTGKKVIPFCTSTSSGLGQSGELLARAAGTGDWQDGRRFSSGASDDEVRAWARGL